MLYAREHDGGAQHAEHAAVKRHAPVPDMEDVQPAFRDHLMPIENAPAYAAACDHADGRVENEVVDVEPNPRRSCAPGAKSRQPPSRHETYEVHDPVPMNLQGSDTENRSDGDGDWIDVRVGQHARYFKLSLTRQK